MSDWKTKNRIRTITKKILHDKGKTKAFYAAEFNKSKARDYPKEGELFDRILSLVYEYEGEMSTPAAIGVLDLVKDSIKGID